MPREERIVEHHWETFRVRKELDNTRIQRNLATIAAVAGWALAIVLATRSCG